MRRIVQESKHDPPVGVRSARVKQNSTRAETVRHQPPPMKSTPAKSGAPHTEMDRRVK